MTIPTRPAPPPPNSQAMSNPPSYHKASSSAMSNNKSVNKKPAPPRPPPPKVAASATVKKSGSQKSVNILSNLFGSSKNSNKSNETLSHTSFEQRIPPKIPAPPTNFTTKLRNPGAHDTRTVDQLINFDESPTSSPPTIKKSNTGSDCVSMDSFCSSTSSPNNLGSGTTSQAER